MLNSTLYRLVVVKSLKGLLKDIVFLGGWEEVWKGFFVSSWSNKERTWREERVEDRREREEVIMVLERVSWREIWEGEREWGRKWWELECLGHVHFLYMSTQGHFSLEECSFQIVNLDNIKHEVVKFKNTHKREKKKCT